MAVKERDSVALMNSILFKGLVHVSAEYNTFLGYYTELDWSDNATRAILLAENLLNEIDTYQNSKN